MGMGAVKRRFRSKTVSDGRCRKPLKLRGNTLYPTESVGNLTAFGKYMRQIKSLPANYDYVKIKISTAQTT